MGAWVAKSEMNALSSASESSASHTLDIATIRCDIDMKALISEDQTCLYYHRMITYRRMDHDPSLDTLLLLDGETFAVEGNFRVKFEVKRVPVTPEKPHGLDYSLTLHDGDGERLLGFDNAHPIREGAGPGTRTRIEYDHKHKRKRVRFDEYKDAMSLLADFWKEVESILKQRSTAP